MTMSLPLVEFKRLIISGKYAKNVSYLDDILADAGPFTGVQLVAGEPLVTWALVHVDVHVSVEGNHW